MYDDIVVQNYRFEHIWRIAVLGGTQLGLLASDAVNDQMTPLPTYNGNILLKCEFLLELE